MVDIAAIASAASALKSAGDITKAAIGLRDAEAMRAKVIELQGVILSAQSSAMAAQSDQFTLLQRVRDLESQIAELEAWDGEKMRYKLEEIAPGGYAYVLKETEHNGAALHQLCVY